MITKILCVIGMTFSIVSAGIAPLVYWWNNDHLTKMQVYKDMWIWWLAGLLVLLGTLCLVEYSKMKQSE